MRIIKRIVSMISITALLLLPLSSYAVEDSFSGTTGDCVWSFDSETGTLTISGEGKMADYADPTNTPWYHLKDYVTKVIADEGVETIGERAFYDFNGIESVVFSDTVEFIDSYAFCRCGKLEDVKFGNGLKNTYWSSFSFCSSLTKITFPDSILQVDDRAFANCTSLTEVNFGKGLSSINYGAFAYCSSLSSISIPANVHEINNEAFYECKSLENVELNEGLIILGTDVFHGCEALKSITIPDSVCFMGSAIFDLQLDLNYSKSIWGSPFSCCEALTEINISADNQFLCYSDGVLFNKDKTVLITYLTTQFDSSYTIPDTVNSISSSAFAFSNLESITIPKSVTVIDESAFHNCVRIKDIYYEGNVDEWENIRTNYNNSVKNMFKNVTVHYNVSSVDEPVSGTTGDCVWGFDSETGTLTISGEGDMADYQDPSDTPWYHLKSSVTKVVVGEGVRIIGERAFYSFDSIKSVELGDDVEFIKRFAFGVCFSLEEVKFGDSLERIGVKAFFSCGKLDNVNLPDSLITLDAFAFEGCTGMKNISLGNSLITISDYTFNYCTNLISISFPKSVKTVGCGAFQGCRNLKDIELNDGLEFIGREAFSSNWELTEITIPDSVRFIGYFEDGAAHTFENLIPGSPFQSDIKLSNIIISENNPYWSFSDGVFYSKDKKTLISYLRTNSDSDYTVTDGVKCIAEYAFMSSTFETVTLPASVVEIIGNPFEQCKNLTDIYFLGTSDDWDHIYESSIYTWSGLRQSGIRVHFLGVVDGPESGTTGDCVWNFDRETGTLTISGEGDMADYESNSDAPWYHLENLVNKVIVTDGVVTVGTNSFSQYFNIKSVEFGNDLKTINSWAFYNCYLLENISFGNSLETIGHSAFRGCSSLEKLDLPDSLELIGVESIRKCASLKELNFGKNLKTIGIQAFQDCIALESITIPDSLRKICNGAFTGCQSLENIHLNDGLEGIGSGAFSNCYSLESITIPDSVKCMARLTNDSQMSSEDFSSSPFGNCTKLKKINISADNKYLYYSDGVLFNKDKTVIITYLISKPDLYYTIPDTVKYISDAAFAYMKLESISIPKSVEFVDDYAFASCHSLKDVYYAGSEEEWNNIRINSSIPLSNKFHIATIHFNESYIPDPTLETQTSETMPATEQIDTSESTATINTEATNPTESTASIITEPTGPTESTAPTVTEPTGPIGPSTPIIDPVTTASTEPKSTEPKATTPSAPKKTQKITAKSCYNLVYGAKSFKIKAKAKGKLSFSAPKNKVIKLSSKGKVKVIGCGIVKVTIKAAKTKVYKKATKKIKITVRPQKPEFKTGKGTVAKYVISFTKVKKISGYEFQYRAKNAKKWKKIYLKKNASRIVLKNLTSIHYRIKLRAYKLVGKKKLYGAFDKASF